MLDGVPVHFWLLLMVGLSGWAPATYVIRHLAHDPSRRDITLPPDEAGWRTTPKLVSNLAILTGLAAFAIFIFTPAAADFARSPSFLPILLGALGSFCLFTVARAWQHGTVEPLVRGFNRSYARDAQPKRYWASMAWNATIGIAMLGLGYWMIDQPLNDPDRTLADYNRAIASNPRDADALYHRARIFKDNGDFDRAYLDYDAALKLRPDHADALVGRGLMLFERGQLSEAEKDYTAAHALDPSSATPLAYRSVVHAVKGDLARAEQDLQAARSTDASNKLIPIAEDILREARAAEAR